MYIVIVGAGEVGSYVAHILVDEGHDVAVVEIDEDLARRLDASLNALVVVGSGVNPAVLRQAGVVNADLLLAVTAIDEVNLVSCMTARKHGGSQLRVVARVRQSRLTGGWALSAEDLGLDALIGPEHAMANATVENLRYPGSGELHELADGRLVLVGTVVTEESPFVQDTLAELRDDLPEQSLVVAVQNQGGFRIPTGKDRLQVNERAFIVTRPEDVTELAILSGVPWYYARHILIVGCGNTGLTVARSLEKQKLSTVIVEADPQRAELVAGLLPHALVLNGDGSDPDYLKDKIEEGEIDAVLVFLKDSEKSVLIGLFAKSLGARKVIVRCDKAAYGHLANRLGIDALISPKRAMIDAILRYVRRGKVKSTMMLGEHDIELTEFMVPNAPTRNDLVEKPLKDLRFPEGALVAAVIRAGAVSIPSGDTMLHRGDRLLVACRPQAVAWVEDLLS